MSSLVPDDTPMLSDGALPPADALPQAAAAAAGAPTGCAPVGPRAAMVALPQSPAALPTHMLAAWSPPSSASSSASCSPSSSSSALLRAYAAASARQLSPTSSSASSSAASSASSSASTSPNSSRRSSFSDDDYAITESIAAEAAARFPPPDYAPHDWPSLEAYQLSYRSWCATAVEATIVLRSWAAPLTLHSSPAEEKAHKKHLAKVAGGKKAIRIGNEEEDHIKAALEAHPLVDTVVRPAHNDKATDLNVRLKHMDVDDFRMVQVKASEVSESRTYLQPARYHRPEYATLVMCVHLRAWGEIYVDYGGCFVEPSVAGGDARAKANEERCIPYNPKSRAERDEAYATAADVIVTLLEEGQRWTGPNCTPEVRKECIGLANAAKLLAGQINLTWQPSSAGGHSAHDATVSGTPVQVKTRSGGRRSYWLPVTHKVDGEKGQPYRQGMAFIFNFTDWPDSMYYLSGEQATAEHFTGPGDLIPRVRLFHPRHIPAGDPMAKYLWPRPGSAEAAAAAASSASMALPDSKAKLQQVLAAVKQKLAAMGANDKQQTSK